MSSKIYIGLAMVIFISFLAVFILPINEIFKGIVSLPGIFSLFSVLHQLWRDERAHQRKIELQNRQQDFILGTASHMADIAYNKHVEFCEEYINKVQEGFQELLREGPSRNALKIGGDLVRIRRKHSAWLTQEIEKKLQPFEQGLIKIGAKESWLLHANIPVGQKRNKIINDIYRSFDLVLGHQKAMNEEEANMHIDKVIEKIRDILGINILTELRTKASELAQKRIKGS